MATETRIIDGKLHFKNPYPTRVNNEWLTAGMIIRLLFVGFSYDKLPKDIRDAVDAEMNRQHTKKYPNTFIPSVKENLLSLEDIRSKLLFHEIRPDDIPEDTRKIIDDEVKHRIGMSLQEWWNEYHAAKYETTKREKSKTG